MKTRRFFFVLALMLPLCAVIPVQAQTPSVPVVSAVPAVPTAAASQPHSIKLPANIPLKRDAALAEDSSIAKVSGFLAALLLVALGLIYWGAKHKRTTPLNRWLQGAGGAGEVKILSRSKLSLRQSIYVVQWHDRQFLLACSDQAMTVVAEQTAPAHAPAATSTQGAT